MPRWSPLWSLLSRFVVLVVVPLSLVLFGVIVFSLVAYQQSLTSLLVDRDQQLAVLVAARVDEAVQADARLLETLANSSDIRGQTADTWPASLADKSQTLQIFDAGVMLVDQGGRVLAVAAAAASPVGQQVADEDYFQRVRAQRQPVFSNALRQANTGQNLVIVAVPILDEEQAFEGALLGGMYLANTPLAASIQQLKIGTEGFAYVVDGTGHVVFHPDVANLGLDFTDRPFVKNVMAGESGGTLWTAATGERLVLGYRPIGTTGWGLIVREPWEAVSAPARAYSLGTLVAGLLAVGVAAYFLWRGVRDITTPVRRLAEETSRLAAGETVEPIAPSSIQEIDRLGRDFNHMAVQVAAYRAGLRRYVGALTQAQEEERRRLARDLHDETVQSLLAMTRRLELYQTTGDLPERLRQQMTELQTMVAETLQGLRHISQDLRPLALDDLGLIPALRTLVRAAHSGAGAVPQAEFHVSGQPAPLTPEQELAMYRITQEALTNIRKHARATGARVNLTFETAAAWLEVVDDGIGFDVPASLVSLTQNNHFGLMGMQERAWAAGGTLSVQSTPGKGARLRVTVPLEPPDYRAEPVPHPPATRT
jgi:signal transduction histidine kinase